MEKFSPGIVGKHEAPFRQAIAKFNLHTDLTPQSAQNYQIKNLQTSFHKWQR